MHEDQADVSLETARLLVDEQFPEWAHLPLHPLPTIGTVNTIFRLGEELTARFPLLRQEPDQARMLLQAEADASSEFAAVSPVPAPTPVALGEPGYDYPLPWSVQTWLPGQDAVDADPASSLGFAADLAGLLTALRQVSPRGRRFTGSGRGGDLRDHDVWMEECFIRSEGIFDVRLLRSIWGELRVLGRDDADVMSHGDLTPPNVLVQGGRLAGVLDTGNFGPADPALDLVSVWHLLDERGRNHVRATLGCTAVQWRRGMAWAFEQAMGLVWYYTESNPSMARWGGRTMERLLAAPELDGS